MNWGRFINDESMQAMRWWWSYVVEFRFDVTSFLSGHAQVIATSWRLESLALIMKDFLRYVVNGWFLDAREKVG